MVCMIDERGKQIAEMEKEKANFIPQKMRFSTYKIWISRARSPKVFSFLECTYLPGLVDLESLGCLGVVDLSSE